jgi:hypothetical protein
MSDTTKLQCNSCNETFDLEHDGGKLERQRDAAGDLLNTVAYCSKCAASDDQYHAKILAARVLVEGSGYVVAAT